MGLAAAGLHSDARDLDWRFTGERFRDPPSGETVEVWRGRFHMTMGSEDALEAAEAAAAFPHAMLVAAHKEGWAHLRES